MFLAVSNDMAWLILYTNPSYRSRHEREKWRTLVADCRV